MLNANIRFTEVRRLDSKLEHGYGQRNKNFVLCAHFIHSCKEHTAVRKLTNDSSVTCGWGYSNLRCYECAWNIQYNAYLLEWCKHLLIWKCNSMVHGFPWGIYPTVQRIRLTVEPKVCRRSPWTYSELAQCLQYLFPTIHFNVILPYTFWSPRWSVSVRFCNHSFVFCTHHAPHMF